MHIYEVPRRLTRDVHFGDDARDAKSRNTAAFVDGAFQSYAALVERFGKQRRGHRDSRPR